MKRKPDTDFVGIRPLNPVSAVCGKPEAIPGLHVHPIVLPLDMKPGAPLEQHDPLICRLVVPHAFRGDLPLGENPLQPNSRSRNQGLEHLLRELFWEGSKEGVCLDGRHKCRGSGWDRTDLEA